MSNSDYWVERFRQLEQAQHLKSVDAMQQIEYQYREAEREIEGQIAKWYKRLADNNEISLAEARKFLKNADLKEFKWDVQDYIKHGQENGVSADWSKELENASAKFHISKLEALKIHLRHSLEVLYAKQEGTITKTMSDVYESGYYHTAFEIQKGVGVGWDIAGVNQSKLEKVLSKPWAVDGRNFSERIWGNKEKLIAEVFNELTQNVMLGRDPQKAIDAIAKKMNTSKTNAGRLVMTEEAYFDSASRKDCFNELGVEKYKIVATLDKHTSDICRELDGKVFDMKDYEPGKTANPFHVNCRTTTSPLDEDLQGIGTRMARDVVTGKTYEVPADMTYKEWMAEQDALHGEGAVDRARKMAYNESADKAQFEKYSVIFNDTEFKNFSEFQNVKYNNPVRWKKIKSNKQSVLNSKSYSEITALNGKLGNKEVRLWYKAQDSKIIDMIDKSVSLEQQALEAWSMRNEFRTQARDLMKDREKANELNRHERNISFEELLRHKKEKYGLIGDAAYEDIIRSSGTTNKDYDRKAGLNDD